MSSRLMQQRQQRVSDYELSTEVMKSLSINGFGSTEYLYQEKLVVHELSHYEK